MSSVQLGGVEGPIFFGPDLQLGLSADLGFRPRARSPGPGPAVEMVGFAWVELGLEMVENGPGREMYANLRIRVLREFT